MIRIVVLVALVLVAIMLGRYLRTLDAEGMKKFWWKFAFVLFMAAIILLTVSGRLHFVAALVAGALPFIKRLWPLIRYVPILKKLYKKSLAKQTGGASIETSLMSMTLDKDTETLDGQVLQGQYQGRALSSLSEQELRSLYAQAAQAHPDSMDLLARYLEYRLGRAWQERVFESAGDMSLSDAYATLGLAEGASAEEVVQAHRKLMQKFHPDRGGTDHLAAQINQAKDLILEKLEA